MAEKKKEYAIGIDLGTTNSCVAVMQHGKPEVIVNTTGGRTTPSIVSFTPNEILFGEPAANNARNDPKNTVYDAKRLIGMEFDDPVVQSDIKNWPFKVVKGPTGKPMIEVTYKEKMERYHPENISAQLLGYLRQTAEAYLGGPVTNAVITVPAYFQNEQRVLTKRAGEMAGLKVLRIINEPTAAAIAYGLDHVQQEKNVLVFDFGGGTFDVSILSIDNGVFEVKATGGNTHLGGSDLDHKVAEYYAQEFAKQKGIKFEELRGRPLSRLRAQVESAKKTLSSSTSTSIMIDSFYKGEDFACTITRAKLEMICKEFLDKLLPAVEKVLSDSKLKKSEIHELVLVGGSTRIPKVQKMLTDFFDGKELNKRVHPDEAVAHGAAIQAANLMGDLGEGQEILLIDVIPLSIGIETAGGIFAPIIPKNTAVPTSKEQTFSTYSDNQTSVTIAIFEGERQLVKDNHKLGDFNLTGIPPARRGEPAIVVTCSVNVDGILSVSASENSSGNKKEITISRESTIRDTDEIKKMQEDAIRNKEQDDRNKAIIAAYTDLDIYIYQVRDMAKKLASDAQATVEQKLNEASAWMEETAPLNRSVEEYQQRKKELEAACSPLLAQGHGAQAQEPKAEPNIEEVD